MKCQVCCQEKTCFWCRTQSEVMMVACLSCAVGEGYRTIEEVLEAKKEVDNEALETESSREGQSMPTLWDKWE